MHRTYTLARLLPFYNLMKPDLSTAAKQTFQVVSLLATILVVGIHYKSAIPQSQDFMSASWNELLQEFWFGGIARVAVPLFAFAAGLFYFRSDDGSWTCYLKKTYQRFFTVLIPYLIVGFIATLAWGAVRVVEKGGQVSLAEFVGTWLLHPPAEQLWFLRDLVMLVVAAPLIKLLVQPPIRNYAIAIIGGAWFFNCQVFPVVAGWYLINLETLFFFVLGCAAVERFVWIERIGNATDFELGMVNLAWFVMVLLRVVCRPDLDLWYTNRWYFFDLVLHQGSILVGCVALFMISWRIRHDFLLRISGASFFVYLVHEFPLRAAVEKAAAFVIPEAYTCWVAFPCVVVGCYWLAVATHQYIPTAFKWIAGGRGPSLRLDDFRGHFGRPLKNAMK